MAKPSMVLVISSSGKPKQCSFLLTGSVVGGKRGKWLNAIVYIYS